MQFVAESQLAEAEGKITQARSNLRQAREEFEVRMEVQRRSPGSISERDVARMQITMETAQGALDSALAARDAVVSQIEFQLPAQKASAEAALQEALVDLQKTLVVAGTDGTVQQFALRPGDVIEQVNRRSVGDVSELRAAVKASGDKPSLFLVNRKGGRAFLTVEAPRA